MKNLTFQEKSLWSSLIASLVVYTLYYINIIPPIEGNMESEHIWQYFKYAGLLIAIVIICEISIRINNKEEPEDERQKLIEMRAERISFYFLSIGIMVAIIVAMKVPGNFWFIQTITIISVLTDIINRIQQLRSFKRGY
jgi:cytochrome b561